MPKKKTSLPHQGIHISFSGHTDPIRHAQYRKNQGSIDQQCATKSMVSRKERQPGLRCPHQPRCCAHSTAGRRPVTASSRNDMLRPHTHTQTDMHSGRYGVGYTRVVFTMAADAAAAPSRSCSGPASESRGWRKRKAAR